MATPQKPSSNRNRAFVLIGGFFALTILTFLSSSAPGDDPPGYSEDGDVGSSTEDESQSKMSALSPSTLSRASGAPKSKFFPDKYKATQRELDIIESLKEELQEKKAKRTPEEIEEDELDEKFGMSQDWLDDPTQTSQTSVRDRVTNIPLALSLRQFSHVAEYADVKKPGMEVQCAVAMMATRNCKLWQETLLECVDKVGKNHFEKILPDRCIMDVFWKDDLPKFLEEFENNNNNNNNKNTRRNSPSFKKIVIPNYDKNDPEAWKKLSRGPIWDSGIRKSTEKNVPYPYIEPKDRTISVFPPGRKCATCEQYPIGFGIPLDRFEKKVWRTKVFDFSPIRPLATPTHGKTEASIDEEDFFHELYVQSFYGISYIRGGADSMRVPEQLSAGQIPFFYDLERVPLRTLGHFPRELIYRAMHLPGVKHMRAQPKKFITGPNIFGGAISDFKRNGEIERSQNRSQRLFDLRSYYEIADLVLEWARRYSTTRSVAAYVLKVLEAENAKRVLIVGRTMYDYLEITLFHGFGELGLNVTTVNPRQNMEWLIMRYAENGTMARQERDQWIRQYAGKATGKGFGYSQRIHPANLQWPWKRSAHDIHDDLKSGKFDVVLFQLDNRHREYVKIATDSGAKVGFIQFKDMHGDPDAETRWACSTGAGPVFIREMNDHKRCR